MKNIITVLLFVLAFTMNVNAQEVKPTAKKEVSSVASKRTVSSKETAKSKEEVASCSTDEKSKSASNEKKSCSVDGSCCGGGKTPPKKS